MMVYRFGQWRYRIRPRLLRKPFSLFYKLMRMFSHILTGIELAAAMESAGSAKQRADLAEALLDGAIEDKSEAIQAAFGLGPGVPDELIRYHELIIRGTVEPVLTRDVSVKLAERFPVDHKRLAMSILHLTGQGHAVKKKPTDSGATPASE
jgi:hypothetical protein